MINTNITNFRKNIYSIIEQTIKFNEPVNVSTKNGNAVILSEEDYNDIMATLLLSSKFGLDWGDTVTEDELLQIASVKLSDMYSAFKRKYSPDGLNKVSGLSNKTPYYLIFDDKEETVWIYW